MYRRGKNLSPLITILVTQKWLRGEQEYIHRSRYRSSLNITVFRRLAMTRYSACCVPHSIIWDEYTDIAHPVRAPQHISPRPWCQNGLNFVMWSIRGPVWWPNNSVESLNLGLLIWLRPSNASRRGNRAWMRSSRRWSSRRRIFR